MIKSIIGNCIDKTTNFKVHINYSLLTTYTNQIVLFAVFNIFIISRNKVFSNIKIRILK